MHTKQAEKDQECIRHFKDVIRKWEKEQIIAHRRYFDPILKLDEANAIDQLQNGEQLETVLRKLTAELGEEPVNQEKEKIVLVSIAKVFLLYDGLRHHLEN